MLGLLLCWVSLGTITNGPSDNILAFSALASRPSTSFEEISRTSTPPDFSVLIRMLPFRVATPVSSFSENSGTRLLERGHGASLTPICAYSIAPSDSLHIGNHS